MSVIKVKSDEHRVLKLLLGVLHLDDARLRVAEHLAVTLDAVTELSFFDVARTSDDSVEINHEVLVVFQIVLGWVLICFGIEFHRVKDR